MSQGLEHAPDRLSDSEASVLRKRLEDHEVWVQSTLASLGNRVDAATRSIEQAKESTERTGLTPLVSRILGRLVREHGLQPEDALLKALALLSRALEAERAGQKIAIIEPDDTIIGEIGGFEVPLALPAAT